MDTSIEWMRGRTHLQLEGTNMNSRLAKNLMTQGCIILWICIACCGSILLIAGCTGNSADSAPKVQSSINVALFPYVPDQNEFEIAIQDAWSALYPDVSINWITPETDAQWEGGYNGYVPADADVFVYDATVMTDLYNAGSILSLDASQIPDQSDFYSFSLEGLMLPNGRYAGIPQLLCTNLLYYWQGDTLANDVNLTDIWITIGNHLEDPSPLPDGEGLYMSLSGGTTDAILYLQVQTQLDGPYTPAPTLPESEAAFDQNAFAWLEVLTVMGGVEQVTDKTINRYAEFASGSGRAAVGYAENSSLFPVNDVPKIDFHTMPFVDSPTYTFFYVDAAAVNANIVASRQPLAIEMAQLISSSSVMAQASLPPIAGDNPQYLLLSRPSAMATLAESYPRYSAYDQVIRISSPVVFHGGPGFVDWADKFKDFIRSTITTPPTIVPDEIQLKEAG
ncbi:MAG: thiamine pyridinylase [Leptolyngbya sp. SIO3F4]|nr:thiamine pyridinylase [Leptolyngbya sp. SIO3F4]